MNFSEKLSTMICKCLSQSRMVMVYVIWSWKCLRWLLVVLGVDALKASGLLVLQ